MARTFFSLTNVTFYLTMYAKMAALIITSYVGVIPSVRVAFRKVNMTTIRMFHHMIVTIPILTITFQSV